MITFPFNSRKASEAVCWLVNEHPGVDLYTIVKALYFADKEHLQRYGRPVVGDRYHAMEHGMVPSNTYRGLRGDRIYGDERDELVGLIESCIERKEEGEPRFYPRREPDLSLLSGSDQRALATGLEKCIGLSFEELRELAHTERAYREAWDNRQPNVHSVRMDYELVIDDDLERREDLLRQLREDAPYMVL